MVILTFLLLVIFYLQLTLTHWPHPPFWVRCGCPC